MEACIEVGTAGRDRDLRRHADACDAAVEYHQLGTDVAYADWFHIRVAVASAFHFAWASLEMDK